MPILASTFYMHYGSKDDLMRESIARPSAILSMIVGGDVTVEMLVPQLLHFHQQRIRSAVFSATPCAAYLGEPPCRVDGAPPCEGRCGSRRRAHLPLQLTALQLAEAQIALIASWSRKSPH